jgi:tetratricopeptide (TPR) repeat protein
MKRLLTILACAFIGVAATAQVKGPDFEAQKRKIAKSDAEIINPKKMDNPKTWISRGDLLQELADENVKGLWPNMSKMESRIIAGDTEIKESEKLGETTYEVLVYPSKKLYFDQDKLACWVQTQFALDDIYGASQRAYEKAAELDVEKKSSKKIKEGLVKLSERVRTEGINAYTAQSYKLAQKYFIAAVDCKMNPVVGVLDTIIAYYAGVVSLADSVKDYEAAAKYLNICVESSFFDKGSTYSSLAAAYAGLGEKKAQEETLINGFTKFPGNQAILIELINLYLNSGGDPIAVIPYLKKAQENEPSNATLYFAEATLYEKIHKTDDAERMYKHTIEIDPKFYNAYYNLGALYYNKGVECIKEADAIKDWKDPKIKELEQQAEVEFKKALEPFLKAHELEPNDKYALETVKNLYFRFRNENDDMMNLYKQYKDKFDALEQEPQAAPQQ